MTERRAPVLGPRHGHISWEEHYQAWEKYHELFKSQSAERIAERGGFGWEELTEFLGHEPKTWQSEACLS